MRLLIMLLMLLGGTAPLAAADWPQWMGPTRDGNWPETGIVRAFPADGAKISWRVPTGLGYAGPAVADDNVLLFDYKLDSGSLENNPGARVKLSGQERVTCYEASSGKPRWQHAYSCEYHISYPSGPRCTPVVAAGKVYTLGAEGNLTCLDLASGKVIWSRALKTDYATEAPIWGFAAHPLVVGDTLYCVVGGRGSVAVAFNAATGEEKWKALTASEPGYCPPSLIDVAGTKQLLIWDADNLNALEPTTGKVLWSEPLKPAYGMSIMMPRKIGNTLFASGIGNVGALFRLKGDGSGVETLWRGVPKEAVYAANATPIVSGDTLYGADCDSGALVAVASATGKRLWATFAPTTGKRRAGHGTAFVVKNGDYYYLASETGDLIIARLTPEKYEEVSRAHILAPTGEAFGREVVWSHPAFANRCCYMRNDEELVCVNLADGS
jgi:outer membrane protein assembly factor BamB